MIDKQSAIQTDKTVFAMLAVITGISIASGCDLATKWVSDQVSIWQLQLMRSVVGAAVLAAFLLIANKDRALRVKRRGVVFMRSFLMAIAFLTYFIAIGILPIAIVAAGLFSSPLFTVIFGKFILREQIGIWRPLSALFGFFGVLLVLQPDTGTFDPTLFWPLACGLSYALTNTYTRKYCKDEHPIALSFWLSILFAVIGFIGMLWFAFQSPALGESDFVTHPPLAPDPLLLLALVGIGVGSILMHFFLATAYQNAPASLLAPLEYIYLPLVAFGGIWFFGETPSNTAYLGISIIITSGVIIAWREQTVNKPKNTKHRNRLQQRRRKQPDYY